MMVWRVRGRELPLDRVLVMGIVNVTPDSFADGGRYFESRRCFGACATVDRRGRGHYRHRRRVDPPGCSGRLGGEEIRRVVPLLESLAGCGHAVIG